MKIKKILSILILSIMIILICNSFVTAEGTKGEEILKGEEEKSPSKGFIATTDTNTIVARDIEMSTKASVSGTYTEGKYQYQIQKGYRITATDGSRTIISDRKEDIAIITKYTGNESTVTIPAKLGGKRVYQIETAAFYKNTTLKKLIIPNGTVGYIGQGAFADCTNLAEVSLGNSVNNISYYAFQNTALTSIKLPASLEFIGGTAFFHCKNLTKITIDSKNVHFKVIDNVIYETNNSNKVWNKYVNMVKFEIKKDELILVLYPYAKKDTTFTMPNNVKIIGYEAIINDYIQTINIPASLEYYWDNYVFTTSKLKAINVNAGNKKYSSINGVLFSKDKKTLLLYPAAKTESTYNIPQGTSVIGQEAFYNASNLKHINIPNSVTKIETCAFNYAKGLEDITIPSSVRQFGAQLFYECPNLKKATISANAELLSYLTFKECQNLQEVYINGNIKTVIKGAFYYCSKLTKVTLPNSLERINFGAFWDCRGLKNITIPKNVVLMEECAFYEHTNISKGYWADTKFDISKTKLKKQANGNYMAIYNYDVKGTRDYDKAYEVLKIVNQERKKAGLKELTMDKDLLENAMKRAGEIVTYFEHERPNGLDFNSVITKKSYSACAENIAKCQPTSNAVMNSWMNSQGHKQNILTSNYTSIGVGCYKTEKGNYYWTQIFTNGTPTQLTKPQNKKTTETVQVLNNRTVAKETGSTTTNNNNNSNSNKVGVTYEAHVQDIGWQRPVSNGTSAGTSGRSKRVEALKIKLTNAPANAKISYQTHVQDIGWQGWKSNGALAGTSGKCKRIEGIKIKLENMPGYTIQYRVHVQNVGWQEWKSDGQMAGTSGRCLRIEAIQIRILKKTNVGVTYESHVQDVGWRKPVSNGAMAGTSGRSKRVEALKIKLTNAPVNAKISYQSHVQDIGWQGWKSNGALTGTSGKCKRVEAIRIKLENMPNYTIQYRVHVQNIGWQEWKSDGEIAGTSGKCLRIEAIQIRILEK